MKIKIKQTFRSMWATILAVLMLLSTFSAVAVTLNKDETGANVDINSTGDYNTGTLTIYFDNTNTNWDTPILKIGHNTYVSTYPMTRVSGTQYLWKYTFVSSWNGYTAFYFTKHSTEYTGSVYKIAYMSDGDATDLYTEQMNNNDVYTPASTTTSHTYVDPTNSNYSGTLNTYNLTTSTYATYNVTSSVTGTGSGTITLKDYDNNTITSGTSVPYLTVITATVTPDDGELSSFTAGGTAISSGDKVTIKSATSFNAVVNKAGLTVYFDNTNTNWSQPYLIYGNSSSATRKTLSRVSGTRYLWKYTFDSSVTNYTAFYFTSIGSDYAETIYKIAYMSDKQATDQITGTMTNNGLYVPASDATAHTYVDPGNNNYSKTFNTYDLTTSSYTTYNVTSTVTGTGSGTITLTDYDGNPVESGSDVPILTVITATVTPDDGELSSFTAGGTAISSGDSVTINSDTSFDAIININQNPVATNLQVAVTSSSPYYVNEPITLGHTEDSVESGATFEYAYTTVASPTNSDWTTLDTATFTPSSAGTYYFRVKASATGYTDVTSDEISVDVSLRLVATSLEVKATPSSCYVNDTITLSNDATLSTGVTDPTYTYQVQKDDGDWADVSGTTYQPASAGTYKFKVTASKDGYATVTSDNTVSVEVTVKPSVAASVTLSGSTTAMVGDTVTYTAEVTDPDPNADIRYNYYINDTLQKGPTTSTTFTHTYSSAGTKDVKVVVTSATGTYLSVDDTVTTTVTEPKDFRINGRFRIKDDSGKDTKIGWLDFDSSDSTFSFTYAGDGKYKFETGCTVKELSEQITQQGTDYQYFFIRNVTDSKTYYVDHTAQNYLNETAKMAMGTSTSNSNSSRFNGDDESGKVTLWIDTSTSGSVYFWYTVPEAVKYEISKIGTNTDKFDTKVNSVSVTEASAGATVTIEINPEDGYEVATVQVVQIGDGEVEGDAVAVSGDGNSRTFTMPESKVTVNVTFKLKDYTMTGVANPSTIGGSVTRSAETANMGDKVTFTATEVSGYTVDSWTVTGVTEDKYTVDGNTVTVTVGTSDVTATANYVGDSYTVTQNASSNGTYTVTGVTDGKAQYGSTVTINPNPATGYELDSITVRKSDGTTVTVTDNSFTMPNSNVTITVKFKSNPGTATTYKFLFNSSNQANGMTAIDGTVYENPTGTYTLTITDANVVSNIVNNSNSYFALSTSSSYEDIFTKSKSPTVSTETSGYISSTGPQDNWEGSTQYYYARASFYNKSEIKQLVITYVYSETSPKYIINAYAQTTETQSLADGVTLEATPTTQTIGKNVTLTATLGTVHEDIPEEAEFIYTFYRGSEELGTVTRTNVAPIAPVKFTTTYNTAGDQSYTVTVSTSTSYVTDTYIPTDYAPVESNSVSVSYRDVVYYYAAVDPDSGNVNTRVAIPESNMVSTTVSAGGTYYFSVFDNDTDTSPESVVDYTVDSANNRYCTISKSSTETGLDYLIVKCNAKCSNPVIYFDKANRTVYAIATQNVGSTKTLDSEKTVTYYFAEERYDSTTKSDPAAGGDGMRIKYWNNSVDNSAYADVTTPVNVSGVDVDGNSTNCNSIFVRVDKFAGISSTDIPSTWNNHLQREFYIYSVELPIWATSFNFVSSSNTALTVDNTSQTGNSSCSSIVLNPNRIYCLFYNGTKNFVRGVVLDESLWDNSARGAVQSNEVTTQGFASNLVNYNTKKGSTGTTGNSTVNNELTTQYGSDYQHPLYFNGWYGTDDESSSSLSSIYGTSNFKLHDNLAMRHNTSSYFASIQNLTDNRLSTTKKNEMGNGYLLGYNGSLMPEFNYEMLKTNSTLVYNNQLYENVQFPFYASTFDGVTTYSYDSTTDRNRLVDTTGDSATVKVSESYVKNGSSYGYFPFGGTGDYNTYGSGTEFDINFYMTNNGKLSNGEDIAFNFSGDDDVWVYVDGVRVLDLGGAHSVSSGTINFSDMKVYYKTAANATDNVSSCKESWSVETEYVKTVSLTDLFEANGVSFSNTDASTQHTLQMFYMERGEGESNCSISFNLPQNTGFRVNSNVTADNVNEALVEDAMSAANKDYFNYQISNKLATSAEYNNVHDTFTNAPARAESVSGLTPSTIPNYPITSLLFYRELLGSTYYLTATGTTSSASDNTWLSSVNDSTFTNLKKVNYTLSDAYAVKATSDDESSPSGRVSESGIFNLLFGQSALFESKIPNDTMIQLSQGDTISNVNAGDGDTTVITAGDTSTRTVSNYYSSSYSIVDDNTGIEIGSGTKSAGTAGSFYADDDSANTDMFYFANYSGETTTSSNAMTVTYTNDVLTSKIKLAKYVAENPSATDNFYFKVEFSKIFGETLDSAKEYTDLQYKVYNSDDELVATRTYGKAGVYFTATQYAIIEGVPVDSAYNVIEKDRAGYEFDSASKTTYNDTTEVETVHYTENSVDGKTVSGADGTTTYDAITFTNTKQAFTVNFKYYDRSVITGTASHISTSPTTVTYSYASLDGYTTDDGDGNTKLELVYLVRDAYAYYKFDNVIDTYTIFTSQSDAEDADTGAGSFKVLREDIDGVTPGVTTYSTAYPDADLGLHYDCYGRPQGTADCKATDGEDWVTYYNGSTKLSQSEAAAYGADVTSITVWLYNTPKKYKPTFYYAPATADSYQLTAVTGTTDRYVAKATTYTISNAVYYNVRLGGVNGNTLNDAATEYLNEYGITKGYCNEIADISSSVTYNSKNLKFLYWASDSSGKNILSTDIAYGYRITNNLKAYAVYGETDLTDKGLTVTPNTPDYYSNSNGKALVRLNNVMNVYNCPEKDTNIKNASIIYIIDYSTADAEGKTQMDKLLAEEGGFAALQTKVREVLKENEASKSFVDGEDIVIKTTGITFEENSVGDIDITGFNHKVVPYNEELNPGTDDIKLTNKNRVQFTTSFTKSNVAELKMYAMLGMDYAEVVAGKNTEDNAWIVSDNLLYYAFDANGNVSSITDPILNYEFYNATS